MMPGAASAFNSGRPANIRIVPSLAKPQPAAPFKSTRPGRARKHIPSTCSRECPSVCRSVHSQQPEPAVGDRPKAWEVYARQSGIDSLYTGFRKRTPSGGFFTS